MTAKVIHRKFLCLLGDLKKIPFIFCKFLSFFSIFQKVETVILLKNFQNQIMKLSVLEEDVQDMDQVGKQHNTKLLV